MDDRKRLRIVPIVSDREPGPDRLDQTKDFLLLQADAEMMSPAAVLEGDRVSTAARLAETGRPEVRDPGQVERPIAGESGGCGAKDESLSFDHDDFVGGPGMDSA